jgi:hypothetical protein
MSAAAAAAAFAPVEHFVHSLDRLGAGGLCRGPAVPLKAIGSETPTAAKSGSRD